MPERSGDGIIRDQPAPRKAAVYFRSLMALAKHHENDT